MTIQENIKRVLKDLPEGVSLMAVAKTRTTEEVQEAIQGGVHVIGENYVQEASAHQAGAKRDVPTHFIGHLQRNKVKAAIQLFDMIETVDSLRLAEEISKRSQSAGMIMPLLIEINSGREPQKFGVMPEYAETLIREISQLPSLLIKGLMTMGPFSGDPENARPYFRKTRELFDHIRTLSLPNSDIDTLSMGMSNSYKVAIEEGASLVRIGTTIFGPRS
jgi:pyridoxal phosphate enzyme (YggS family)